MPVITPSLVPTIPPGSLFQALTTKPSLNVRWLTSLDPVFYEVLNRPHADIVLRQLILAKAIDTLDVGLGHQALFPYLIQPQIAAGSGVIDVPPAWIWDLNLSLPTKWSKIRLAKIKRVSGLNSSGEGTDGAGNVLYTFTGKLRLIFTGQQGNAAETALLMADYTIDSQQTYQPLQLLTVPASEEAIVASMADQATMAGYIIFKTLDYTQLINQQFILTLAPPPPGTPVNTDGTYTTPTVYPLADAIPASPQGWYNPMVVPHGTGMLCASAWNAIPTLAADVQSWINAFNYPFDAIANRMATNGLIIPLGMFREFSLCAPAGDQPTGDTSGTFYPVWITRIARIDQLGHHLRFFFATYNVTDLAPSPTPVEFATMDLLSNMTPGEIVDIDPAENLQLQSGTDQGTFGQHFGRGHVVLSDMWGPSANSGIQAFFNTFGQLSESVAEIDFTPGATRLSSFGLSRVPKYTPTVGQSQAMKGSSGRFEPPLNPSDSNRFVTELDQGGGVTVDLEAQPGITPDPAVQRFGQIGALCHRIVRMIVDPTLMPEGVDNDVYYNTVILPRLTILLGRPPQFGDGWYNGTRFMWHNGDTWQG
jgi:hypothetical protein